MLDTNTLIQCFVRVSCVGPHCTDCAVNCIVLQNLIYKFTFYIVTSVYDVCLERYI